ncbi:Hvo_1808 family surface protein [Candidatus Hikarchaeum yamanae]|uniref:Hvo_1808 family surface protein n=1 Tax=Candidatus Hikarchaeum yamanae TaxID=2675326 RepID=UPI0039E93989|tara:strand:+ start:41737 stop:43326 length:1590 start_codon:yes stop_codon:yes gene_type:complete
MRYPPIIAVIVVLLIASLAYSIPSWNGNTDPLDIFSNIYDIRDPLDPSTPDTVGSENGYHHADRISIDQSDGLSDDEILAYVSRAHARTEYILNLEFDKLIPINVTTTNEFVKTHSADDDSEDAEFSYSAWNNQVWEAIFIIGENQAAESELENTSAQSIAGVYTNGQIVIVNDSDDALRVIPEDVLIHELVHALQDQEGLFDTLYESSPQLTQDTQLSTKGLSEGHAMYVEWYYDQVCNGSISVRNNSLLEEVVWGDWQCVPPPKITRDTSNSETNPPPPPVNFGALIILFHPYSDGGAYVAHLKSQDGWDSVNAKYASPPLSTEQIIHLSEEKPSPLEINFPEEGIPSHTGGTWKSNPDHGIDGADTVGEASIFSMFWHQSREYNANAITTNTFWNSRETSQNSSGLQPSAHFNYTSPPSTGWGNDKLLPIYRSGTDQTEYGYIWTTKWDTPLDANEFHTAYSKIIAAHHATKIGKSDDGKTTLWVIQNGPFADSFAISTTSKTVTIVNAPTPADVEEILTSFSLSV